MQKFDAEKRNLYAFICLIRNKSSLFSDAKRQELYNICFRLEDNITILSDAVSEWCQQSSNSQIREEFGKERRSLFRVPSAERPPGTENYYLPKIDIEANRKNLLNAIQVSCAPDTPQPSQSDQQSSTSNISQPPN